MKQDYVNLRVHRYTLDLLRKAAAVDSRSITQEVSVLVKRYCKKRGIDLFSPNDPDILKQQRDPNAERAIIPEKEKEE